MKKLEKRAKGLVRFQILISVGILLSVNTFAWFVYSARVSNSITATVRAWKINFEHSESEIVEFIDIEVDDLYPGMETYTNVINIVNYGDTPAGIEYEIVSAKIFDDLYESEFYTVSQIESILENDYPFVIDLTLEASTLDPLTGEVDFTTNISWAFESGDDDLDTYWGNKAYQYKLDNPESSGIELHIKLTAVQTVD